MADGESFAKTCCQVKDGGHSDEIERLHTALEWYATEAEAAARHMTDKNANADSLTAILTVLANDGGGRARLAMSPQVDTKTEDFE